MAVLKSMLVRRVRHVKNLPVIIWRRSKAYNYHFSLGKVSKREAADDSDIVQNLGTNDMLRHDTVAKNLQTIRRHLDLLKRR